MAKMEKMLLHKKVESYLSLSSFCYGELKTILKYIQELYNKYTKEGYINLSLEYSEYYDGSNTDVFLYGNILETDEEFAKRVKLVEAKKISSKKAAKTRAVRKEERDKKLYEKLKVKYGK